MEVGMMLNSGLSSQNSFGGPVLSHGLSCGFRDTASNVDIRHGSWTTVHKSQDDSSDFRDEESSTIINPDENTFNQASELVTAHWTMVEEEPGESTHELLGLTNDNENANVEPAKTSLDSNPFSAKTEKIEQKYVSSAKVTSTLHQSRKSYISRSVSLTEKELKEAQYISDNNGTQVSPTQGSCSRGALLFHRRRQKLKALEQQRLAKHGDTLGTQQTHSVPETKTTHNGLKKTEPQLGSEQSEFANNMAETSSDAGYEEVENTWGDELRNMDFPPVDKRAPSPSASEDDHQSLLSAHLKETLAVSNTSGLVNQICLESEPTTKHESKITQNGTQNKQYCEVHLTLSKPKSVSNRTARPFGIQPSAKKNQSCSEKSFVKDLPPPPTYAETLSSPPPVTRIISPPAYSVLYPTDTERITPVTQVANHRVTLTPQPKTGILEEMGARRGSKKSMFTFIEKPRMTPNPDLLSMVQTADERRKNKDQVDVPTEEEPFALGAEASNFQNNKTVRETDNTDRNDNVPDWSTCLKSPGVRTKPPPAPIQTLTEAKGKGAELFARRQSRMERFLVESPSYDSIRSPSPTMSLPPSWKYVSNAHSSSTQFGRQVKTNQRSPRPSSAAPATNPGSESAQSQKDLEISKRQPYQLQSSLFIFSPTKDPVSSLPKAAPPPKPMVMESQRYTRQLSCPSSPMSPSPTICSPPYIHSMRSPSATLSPSPTGFGRQTPTSHVSPISPVPFTSTGVAPSRTKTIIQAPRPTFSARNAGLESQTSKGFVPASPTQRALQHRGSLDGWGSSALSFRPVYEEGSGIQTPPPSCSRSSVCSDESPSSFKVENDLKAGRQIKALLARNIINAAKRKSTSPWGLTSPQSTISSGEVWNPSVGHRSPLSEIPRARRSPTGSDISLESEDSGAKSPGFQSYAFSPKGWYGSLRLKRNSLPANQPFAYTP